ncbi:AbrB/MazE/SpoVT family DNA-binding domain-containing protein [Candidatus Villigracilis affinis]|uniref:AbrB/MazE/SpoVT family DNA-binding domain-containing protein n=1 Tax=Candidatus Villigracilis affinis TaxID=3140682 RepID=UPI002A21DA99|nr:AbrB/MazE/SpoVT family DNA-binding domain-containing protein [Anaerolineales bacterium]
MNKKHLGSNFDDFLKEEKLLKQTHSTAVKRLGVKVNGRNQITLPRNVREKLKIKTGDYFLVNIQNGMMILVPQPESNANHMQGLHAEIWKDINTENYLDEERKAWED